MMALPHRSLDMINSSPTNVSLDNINFCSTASGTTSACSSPSTSSMSTPSTMKRTLGSFSTNGAVFSAATNQSRHLLKRSQTGPSQLFASLSLIGPRGILTLNNNTSKTIRATVRSMSNEEERFVRHYNTKMRFSLPQPSNSPLLDIAPFAESRNSQCLRSPECSARIEKFTPFTKRSNSACVELPTRKESDSASFHLKEVKSEVPVGCAFVYSYKILEFLHCGTVEAAYNRTWLCQNHIAYLVNLNGVQQMGKGRKRQNCICGEQARHQLKEIFVKINPTSSTAEVFDKFMLVNQFIAEARTKGAQILLYNSDAQNWCQAFCIQYCMHYHKISLNYAICHIERVAKLKLCPEIQNMLEMWENRLKSEQQQLLARTISSIECPADAKEILTTIPEKIIEHNAVLPRKIAWS